MLVQTEVIQVIDISKKNADKIEYSLYADFSELKFLTKEEADDIANKLNKIIEENVRN